VIVVAIAAVVMCGMVVRMPFGVTMVFIMVMRVARGRTRHRHHGLGQKLTERKGAHALAPAQDQYLHENLSILRSPRQPGRWIPC